MISPPCIFLNRFRIFTIRHVNYKINAFLAFFVHFDSIWRFAKSENTCFGYFVWSFAEKGTQFVPRLAVFTLFGPVMQTQICFLWCHSRKTLLYKIGDIRFSCQFSVCKIVKLAKSSLNSAAALAIIRKARYCKGNNLIVFDLN